MSKVRAQLGSHGIFATETPAAVSAPAKPAAAGKDGKAAPRADREGKVPLPFWTTAAAKKQLRMMAAESDTTQQDLMSEALNLLFRNRGKPPIA